MKSHTTTRTGGWQAIPGLCAVLCGALLGCSHLEPAGSSPLGLLQMSHDSVVLEMAFVRFAHGDPAMNEELWHDVDEQVLLPETRRELAINGLRVGVVGAHIPQALEEMLAAASHRSTDPQETVVQLDEEANVVTKHSQVRPGKPLELLVSGPHPQLSILEYAENGSLVGEPYPQAECRFTLRANPHSDGRVEINLLPEVHHGDLRPQITTDAGLGVAYFKSSRSKRVFDNLRTSATIAPGEMLLVGGLPELSGSIGDRFFSLTSETTGERQQKLLVIRLLQTQYDDAFSPQ